MLIVVELACVGSCPFSFPDAMVNTFVIAKLKSNDFSGVFFSCLCLNLYVNRKLLIRR